MGDLVEEAEEINRTRAKEAGMKYEEFVGQGGDDVMTPEEAFLYATTETQEAISKGWAGNYALRLDRAFEHIGKLKKA